MPLAHLRHQEAHDPRLHHGAAEGSLYQHLPEAVGNLVQPRQVAVRPFRRARVGAVEERPDPLRRALVQLEVPCHVGEPLDDLHARGAAADHSDALALERDGVIPLGGVETLALEPL